MRIDRPFEVLVISVGPDTEALQPRVENLRRYANDVIAQAA